MGLWAWLASPARSALVPVSCEGILRHVETDAGQRKRCKRWDIPWSVHFLTFSCFGRRAFLSKDRSRRWLLVALERARALHAFDLWGWVIMPEHVHLLIWARPETEISPVLKSVKQPVARAALAWVRREAPQFLPQMLDLQPNGRRSYRFWQRGGGYDRSMRTVRETYEKLHYIHQNPVHRGLADRAEDWPWSSARAWALGIDEPVRIDRGSFPDPEVTRF